MTQIRNVQKVFAFRVEINGFNQFECQKFKKPDVEVEAVEHGDVNKKVKTAGQVKIGDWTMEKLRPIAATTDDAWNWLLSAQNPNTGTGGLAEDYMDTVIIRELAPNMTDILKTWVLEEAWISKISTVNFDRMSSDNVIETITGQCNDLQEY